MKKFNNLSALNFIVKCDVGTTKTFIPPLLHNIRKSFVVSQTHCETSLIEPKKNGHMMNLIKKTLIFLTYRVTQKMCQCLNGYNSVKNRSMFKILVSIDIVSSWSFQNCPWNLNLTKICLRYLIKSKNYNFIQIYQKMKCWLLIEK